MITNKWTGEEFPVYSDKAEVFTQTLNDTDSEYHGLMEKILTDGLWKENRTGTKTISIFGPQVRFNDVGNNFPLLTTKKVHLKSVIGELLWFLEGSTDKKRLKEHYGTSIWDEWTGPNSEDPNDMGPIYGNQWVNWRYSTVKKSETGKGVEYETKSINQLQGIIDTLKTNPDDRRMIVSAWRVEQLQDMALPPCHWSFQFYTNQFPGEEKRRLHLIWNQRSVDTGLGLPFNIASYSLMLLMMAQEVDMIPGDLIGNLGDAHIYEDHITQLSKQLSRNSKGLNPTMKLNPDKGFWDFTPEDFTLENYDPQTGLKMPISV